MESTMHRHLLPYLKEGLGGGWYEWCPAATSFNPRYEEEGGTQRDAHTHTKGNETGSQGV